MPYDSGGRRGDRRGAVERRRRWAASRATTRGGACYGPSRSDQPATAAVNAGVSSCVQRRRWTPGATGLPDAPGGTAGEPAQRRRLGALWPLCPCRGPDRYCCSAGTPAAARCAGRQAPCRRSGCRTARPRRPRPSDAGPCPCTSPTATYWCSPDRPTTAPPPARSALSATRPDPAVRKPADAPSAALPVSGAASRIPRLRQVHVPSLTRCAPSGRLGSAGVARGDSWVHRHPLGATAPRRYTRAERACSYTCAATIAATLTERPDDLARAGHQYSQRWHLFACLERLAVDIAAAAER